MTASAVPSSGLADVDVDVAAILRDRDVRLVYQPIIDIVSDTVVAVEALARFPTHGTPLRVFAAAEVSGLSADLEALVLHRAIYERLRVPSGLLLTLNVTPHHLLDGPVAEALDGSELDGLVIELTERSVPPDPELLVPVIDRLRANGALVALDDTGAGYQGIQQVASLRPDWVKIDRSVVTGAADDEVQRASLQMFVRVAKRVGALTVAEGVESAADVDVLLANDIGLAQGFFLGQPTPHPKLRQRS
jgi:EAL domain-containing protein (putative c-di-GMP-specific phosphodiesterase class I)